MPIWPELKGLYPPNWEEISRRIRFERAGGYCERCGAMDAWLHPETGVVVQLQTAHLDHDPGNSEDGNLTVLCQACHNCFQSAHHSESTVLPAAVLGAHGRPRVHHHVDPDGRFTREET